MKFLKIVFLLFIVLLFPLCSSCINTEPADGFEELQGNWVIKGYEHNNNIYSTALDSQVNQMLKFDDIEFFKDGTYEYYSLFEQHGKYRRLTTDEHGNKNPDSADFLIENNYIIGADLDDKTGEKKQSHHNAII